MQFQENPARVLLGLHGDSTEGFLLKNLYCLECGTTRGKNHVPPEYVPADTMYMVNIL